MFLTRHTSSLKVQQLNFWIPDGSELPNANLEAQIFFRLKLTYPSSQLQAFLSTNSGSTSSNQRPQSEPRRASRRIASTDKTRSTSRTTRRNRSPAQHANSWCGDGRSAKPQCVRQSCVAGGKTDFLSPSPSLVFSTAASPGPAQRSSRRVGVKGMTSRQTWKQAEAIEGKGSRVTTPLREGDEMRNKSGLAYQRHSIHNKRRLLLMMPGMLSA